MSSISVRVHPLDRDRLVLARDRDVVGGAELVGVADGEQRHARRLRDQLERRLEDRHARRLRADERARDLEPLLGEQLVEVVARDAARDLRIARADLVGVRGRRAREAARRSPPACRRRRARCAAARRGTSAPRAPRGCPRRAGRDRGTRPAPSAGHTSCCRACRRACSRRAWTGPARRSGRTSRSRCRGGGRGRSPAARARRGGRGRSRGCDGGTSRSRSAPPCCSPGRRGSCRRRGGRSAPRARGRRGGSRRAVHVARDDDADRRHAVVRGIGRIEGAAVNSPPVAAPSTRATSTGSTRFLTAISCVRAQAGAALRGGRRVDQRRPRRRGGHSRGGQVGRVAEHAGEPPRLAAERRRERKPGRDAGGERHVRARAQPLDGVHRPAGIVGVETGTPKTAIRTMPLSPPVHCSTSPSSSTIASVAATTKARRSFGATAGTDRKAGGDPPVLVGRPGARGDARRRHRVEHAGRPCRELADRVGRENAGLDVVLHDLAAPCAIGGGHRAVESVAQVDDDVARCAGAHERRHRPAGDANPHVERDRAGQGFGAGHVADEGDHLVRCGAGRGAVRERHHDRVATEGDGIASMGGDDVDRPPITRRTMVPSCSVRRCGAGRDPRTAREPGDVEEEGDPVARQVL